MRSNLLRLFSIFLIFVTLSVYCQDTTDYSQCNRDLPVNQVNIDFGTLNGFYSIAKGIAYGLQGQLPDDVVQDIYNLLTQGSGVQNIGDLVSAIIKSQDKSSKIKIIIYLALLVAAFALVVTAIIIYNQSALNVYSQIDKGDEYTNLIFDDLQSVISNGTEELTCSTNVGVNQTFSTMTTQMQQFPNGLFSNFSDQTGITALQRDNDTTLPAIKDQSPICQADIKTAQDDLKALPEEEKNDQGCADDIQNLNATLVQISALLDSLNIGGIDQIQTGMNDLLTTVNANINATNSTINDQIQLSTGQMTQTQAEISQTINGISSSVNDTMGQVYNIANIIKIGRKDVVDWSGYGWVKMGVRLIFTLPAAITLLFIALTVLALVFVFISKNEKCSDFNVLVQNFTTLYRDITFSSDQLSPENIGDTKSSMIDTTNSQFDFSYAIVNESLYDLINQLSSQAFPCYPLVNIYMNTGNIICDAFGRPIHGIWASSGLAAIIYLPLAIILLLSSRWLFIGNSSGSLYTSGRTKKGKASKNHAALTSAWEQDELPPPRVVHLPSPYESSPYESSSGVRVHPYNQ
ncbi:hypothetical protein WR25_11122 [Diploscapter pachys]|uniref:Protein tweety homolog n=1 Tax=Diploscapter pachys TaxID=2018661 RepID=A0A2A2JJ49_9BILA|nr:hypothetical protein WR25_11122 [Diploscapter pachys]